jgi:Predicted site-specific integrase-resolvase
MEPTMSTGKAAKLLGVSVKTLQRWEREGRLIPVARTDSNRRLSTETQIREFIGLRQTNHAPTTPVASCRVSSAAQRTEVANQRNVPEAFVAAKGWAGVACIEEIGGGLNCTRKRFSGPYGRDRATGSHDADPRAPGTASPVSALSGFEHDANTHGCDVLVRTQERLSPEQEMVQDLMTIVHGCSSRLLRFEERSKEVARSAKTGCE